MKKYTLYIHAGRQKTGTTELQRFFTDNTSVLRENGILYPRMGLHSTDQLRLSWEANNFVGKVTNKHTKNLSPDKYWEILSENLSLQNSDLLVSSEGFYWDFHPKFKNERIKFIASLFPKHQIKVIVYVREQYAFLNSLRNEYIKTGHIEHNVCNISKKQYFENAIKDGLCDYTLWVKNLELVLGRENLVLKEYDRARLKNGDIVEDFLSEINIPYDADTAIRQNRDANPKINGVVFESLLTYIGRYFPSISHRSRNRLCKALLSAPLTEQPMISVLENSNRCLPSFKAENSELAEKYFAGGKIFTSQFDDFDALPENDDMSKAAQLIGCIWQTKESSEIELLKENEKLWELLTEQKYTNAKSKVSELEELRLRTRTARILYYLRLYSSKKIAIFGYNDIGVGVAEILIAARVSDFELVGFIDRLGKDSSISGVNQLPVIPIESVDLSKVDTVILATESSKLSMKEALISQGYKGEFILYDQYEE